MQTHSHLISDRQAAWPAWGVSLAVHVALFAGMLFLLRTAPQGAVEQPVREVGIVLKRMTDQGPLFEGESEQLESVQPESDVTAAPNLDSLPSPTEIAESLERAAEPILGLGPIGGKSLGAPGSITGGAEPSRKLGGQATVRVFGVEGTGTRFVYVFDRSISMRGPPLRAAKEQLIASLDALESVHQFQIIFFNHELQVWDLSGGQQRIAFATEANKQQATRFIEGITAAGGTYRREALSRALGMRPDVVFFLSDADDPMPDDDVEAAIQRCARAGISINTIEFGIGPSTSSQNFLTHLASATAGQYVYVDTLQLDREPRR